MAIVAMVNHNKRTKSLDDLLDHLSDKTKLEQQRIGGDKLALQDQNYVG